MKTFTNETGANLMTRTARNHSLNSALRFALVAILAPMGMALASDGDHRRPVVVTSMSGHVEVVHQIPGGVISVGVEIGRPRPVVVEHRREVVVVERPRHHHRDVTIIREEPRREVTVIKTVEKKHCGKEVTVIEKRVSHDRDMDRDYDKRPVSYDRNDGHGQEHYYSDANQVSYQSNGRDGSYHYYEDANQVSIQDNRNGQNRNVYVRK